MKELFSQKALAAWKPTADKEYPRLRPASSRLRRRNGHRLGVTTIRAEDMRDAKSDRGEAS